MFGPQTLTSKNFDPKPSMQPWHGSREVGSREVCSEKYYKLLRPPDQSITGMSFIANRDRGHRKAQTRPHEEPS